MKSLFTHIILLFSIYGFTQTNEDFKMDIEFSTSEIDSLVNEAEKFINSKVSRIELIKILPNCEKYIIYEVNGDKSAEKDCYQETIIEKESTVKKIKLKENLIGTKKELKKSDFITFLQTLYNQNTDIDYAISSCYAPRHGILFYNTKNKIIGFFEICFECTEYTLAGKIPRLILLPKKSKLDKLSEMFDKYDMKE